MPYSSIPYEVNACREHRAYAVQMAEKSVVLLKNDGILPLDKKKLKTIAVIGPNADSRDALMGNYFGTPLKKITVLDAILNEVGEAVRVYYSEGCHLYKNRIQGLGAPKDRFAESVGIAKKADVAILCKIGRAHV